MPGRADPATALDVLSRGEVTMKGRMPRSSNATFLVELALDDVTALAVYKPERGERPLWDFPPGLYRREIAAYLLSEALGWGLVPPTAPRTAPGAPFTRASRPPRYSASARTCSFSTFRVMRRPASRDCR